MSYEDEYPNNSELVKELEHDTKFKPTISHEVIEYTVDTGECPTIDSMRQKLSYFLHKFKNSEKMQKWVERTVGRRILYCPTSKAWHVIVFINKDEMNCTQLGEYFDWAKEIGFQTAHRLRSSSGEAYDELQAEADGCIAVLQQNFTDQEYQQKNVCIVANLLAKITH